MKNKVSHIFLTTLAALMMQGGAAINAAGTAHAPNNVNVFASAVRAGANNISVNTSSSLGEVSSVSKATVDGRVLITFSDGAKRVIAFYGPQLFRVYEEPVIGEAGGPGEIANHPNETYINNVGIISADASMFPTMKDPEAKPEAKILVDNAKKDAGKITVSKDANGNYTISTTAVRITVDKTDGKMAVEDLRTGKTVVKEIAPATIGGATKANGATKASKSVLTFAQQSNEYFFGGGVQNGRFSHKNQVVNIVNENSWTDGGVCSPAPFYWSTGGYGFMAYTFQPGQYDFGAQKKDRVVLTHNTDYLDYFIMVDTGAVALLNDYYQLTGHPVLLPKFGFYEGHLNAYNRDYWKEVPKGSWGAVLFEDGKYYKEDQKDNGGYHESLNGQAAPTGTMQVSDTEKGINNTSKSGDKSNNGAQGGENAVIGSENDTVAYQFSARAVVDRYKRHDMPLGWVLPNDGYGAGYGQTSSLEGNIQNLKDFGDYARKNGVEIGLWTQSDLHPIDTIAPLLQRDIVREIKDAGVRVLKTDVAWVGAGYSFGLNGISEVASLMSKYGHGARPFIISLDGWAGTQRYAGVWSGDQTGGQWEYIRFHIPTFIGAGLAGMPNITSDVDGIFGGRNMKVNVREYQWKTFTPMQLNMDGWGSNEKYPQALGEPATSINRAYLKMKSMLMPYAYSIAHEAVDGKPMIRALMLDEPNTYTLGKKTEYEYLYGPSLLVAPIYQETAADTLGNDIRNNIYLPKGQWIDYFTGNIYQGGAVLNSFDAPLWKLPVLVKAGAIIPVTNPNNNPSQIDQTVRRYDVYPVQTESAGKNSAATKKGATAATGDDNLIKSEFFDYDDDGYSVAYLNNESTSTYVALHQLTNTMTVNILQTTGDYKGFQKNKATVIRLVGVKNAKKITATIGGKKVKLTPAKTAGEMEATEKSLGNTTKGRYIFNARTDYNKFFTQPVILGHDTVKMQSAPALEIALPATDITAHATEIRVEGCEFYNKSISARGIEPPTISLSKPQNAGVKESDRKPYSLTLSWQPVDGAEAYEIQYDGMDYFDIRSTSFLFEDLRPETDYSFRVRATAKGKASEWVDVRATTNRDPYEFAVKGITAQSTAPSQGGQGLRKLFDFDKETGWHTEYGKKAVPFTVIIDLHSVNTLDKLEYLPRQSGTNGILQKGRISVSTDKQHWQEQGPFQWAMDATLKTFPFAENLTARYVRIDVEKGGGDFGSGQELYIFRREGTPYYIPGDINNDGHLDENDLTSYMNYNGLRQGDSDFEGYVSKGDINGNGLIDAYDISNAAVEIDGYHPEKIDTIPALAGKISVSTDKASYKAGEEIVLTVKGTGMKGVNAFSLSLPYSEKQMQYLGIEAAEANTLDNYTRDRLHTNGQKAVYITFVGKGDATPIEGDHVLCTIKFKAIKAGSANLKAKDIILVDKELHTISLEDK